MLLSDFSIRRPVAATVIILVLVIFGIVGLGRLGILLYPDVDFPIISVSTVWKNARPEEVDNNITDELEDTLGSIEGIKHITSNSHHGISIITVEFELFKDVDVAAQEVRDKTTKSLEELPDDAEYPSIDKIDINAQPVIWIALTGQYPIEKLTDYADNQIKPFFQKLKGAGDVIIFGRKREVRIWLNRDRLAAYNIGVNEVMAAIKAQHIEVPGGKVESPAKEFIVRTIGEFSTEDAFNKLIVTYCNGNPIRIHDIGHAEAGREDLKWECRYWSRGGKSEKTVGIGIAPRSGANEVEMAELAKKELEKVRRMLPEGMHMELAIDDTIFVEDSISEVKFQLIIGGIMAALVIFLFLQNIRTTIFSSIAIPVSIISTFGAVYAFGFTLNNMTLMALITAVGLVIDDSIIMEENIYRHRFELKKPIMQAAIDGSREIGFAVLAATLTLAGVFLPVAFMGGIVGRFFKEFALTMAFAVTASMIVALTLEPMLASRFLKPGGEKMRLFKAFDLLMRRGTKLYRRSLAWLLHRRYVVLLLFLLALFAGGLFFTMLGKEFVSAEDKSQFIIRLETPLSYSIYKTDDIVKRVEKIMQTVPEIINYFSVTGYSGTAASEANKAMIFVTLLPKKERRRSQLQIMSEMRNKVKVIPDLQAVVSEISILGSGSRSEDVQFVIQGPSLESLDEYSRKIIARLENTPGFIDIDRSLDLEKPEARVIIDRDKAADMGVPVSTIAQAVGALIGGVDVVEYKSGGENYDVRLRLTDTEREIPADIDRIWVHTMKGETVDLASFVTIKTGVGPSVINRLDRQRSVSIFTNLEGMPLAEAQDEIDKITTDVITDEAYTVKYIGESEAFKETIGYVIFAFILAVVLTYLVLSAQFESFIHPFSIMMGLPLSFAGAFGLLLITGNTFNLFSMLAMILLVGLPAKNGILLIDYTNQLRESGLPVNEALVKACGTRLRPILMTAISTIAGVIPVAMGLGVGAESRQALAIAITGGMFSSTLLTLLVVPIIYSYLDDFTQLQIFGKIKEKIWVDENGEKGGSAG